MEDQVAVRTDFRQLMNSLCEVTIRNNGSYERRLLTGEFCSVQQLKCILRAIYTTFYASLNSPYIRCLSLAQTERFNTLDAQGSSTMMACKLRSHYQQYIFLFNISGSNDAAERLDLNLSKLDLAKDNPPADALRVLHLLLCLAGTGEKERDVQHHSTVFSETKKAMYTSSWVNAGMDIPSSEMKNITASGNQWLFAMKPGSHSSYLNASFGIKDGGEAKYFRDLKCTLYGGLTQSRSANLHMTLAVPEISTAFHLPKAYISLNESSEDEGFVSAVGSEGSESPAVPQSESSNNDLWIWDTSRHRQLDHCLSWEKLESPTDDVIVRQMSESGKEGFDHLYNIRLHQSYGISLARITWQLVTEEMLLADIVLVLGGISSGTFKLNKIPVEFVVSSNLRLPGVSMEALNGLLVQFAKIGSHYEQLRRFCQNQIAHITQSGCGTTLASLIWSIRQYLTTYLVAVTTLKDVPSLTLLRALQIMSSFGQQLRFIVDVFAIQETKIAKQPHFQSGTSLLLFLHALCKRNSSSRHFHLLVFFLKRSMAPFLRFISDWVFSGICTDPFDEFFIQIDDQYLEHKDKYFWTRMFHLKDDQAGQILPLHFGDLSKDIFDCGKSLNLLRAVEPTHYLFSLDILHPPVAVSLILQDVESFAGQCDRYAADMKQLAEKYHKDKRQKLLVLLLEKEKTFTEERNRIKKYLIDAQAREEEVRIALSAKKSEEMDSLRKQMENAIERKKKQMMDEAQADKQYMIQMQQLDEQQQKQMELARKELLQHYDDLTQLAIRRESRALWKIKRMNLSEKRRLFLKEEQKAMDVISITMKHSLAGQDASAVENNEIYSNDHKVLDANNEPHDETPNESADNLTVSIRNEQTNDHDLLTGSIDTAKPMLTAASGKETNSTPSPRAHISEAKGLIYANQVVEKETEAVDSSIGSHDDIWHPGMKKGKETSSTAQELLYPDKYQSPSAEPLQSTRGSEPQSKMKAILYPGRDDKKDKPDEGYVRSHELVVADSWFDYHATPFSDKFSILDEKPATIMEWKQDTVQDEFNNTLLNLPLGEVFQRCLLPPMLMQIKLVNGALLDYFFKEINIEMHFVAFRKFVLLEDGEFGHELSSQLFKTMTPGANPIKVCSPVKLNGIISKALQLSLAADKIEVADQLSFSLKDLPAAFKSSDVASLDFLELRYKVPWPCNIIITDNCVMKYNKVFAFLLKLKRMNWVLRNMWRKLKRAGQGRHAAASPQLRQLQLYRHEMQHFVNNVDRYMVNQIIHTSWQEFQNDIRGNISSVDKLHECHLNYINKIIFRSLLSKNATPVLKIILDVFGLILKFHVQLDSSPWETDEQTGHVKHSAFDKMCGTHSSFKEFTGFLFTVVSKLVQRGYQHHLQDFLLQVNFNGFYATAVV